MSDMESNVGDPVPTDTDGTTAYKTLENQRDLQVCTLGLSALAAVGGIGMAILTLLVMLKT